MDVDENQLRNDMILLVTAQLGGHPRSYSDLQELLLNQSAEYTVNLVHALVEGIAINLTQMAGSPEAALQALQAEALKRPDGQ